MRAATQDLGQKVPVTKTGEVISYGPAIASYIPSDEGCQLIFYGKSTQNGTPTPTAPVPVVPVSGTATVCGRNMFDVDGWYDWINALSQGNVSKTTVDDIPVIKLLPYGGHYNVAWMANEFKAGTTYTMLYRAKGISGSTPSTGFSFMHSNGTNIVTYIPNDDEWHYMAHVSYPGWTVIGVTTGYQGSQGAYIDPDSIILVEGDYVGYDKRGAYPMDTPEFVPYEPFVGASFALPELHGIGNYADTYEPCVMVDGELRSRLTRRIGVLTVLGGNLTQSGKGVDSYLYYSNYWTGGLGRSVYKAPGLCNYFINTNDNPGAAAYEGMFSPGASEIYALFNLKGVVSGDNASTGAGEADNWVRGLVTAGNPIIVYYPLAVPVVTLGDPIIIEIPDNNASVTTSSTVKGNIRASILAPRNKVKWDNWRDIQRIVRNGLAPTVFSIGDQLTCKRGAETLIWDVIGFDHDTPVDTAYTHSMTLQINGIYRLLSFDEREALYYAETELPAGTYNFTAHDNITYNFTLTQPVPQGGQIDFPWSYNLTPTQVKMITYPSRISTTAIESNITIDAGAIGTALESIGPCNHTYRCRYGSNEWQNSYTRLWLNSNAPAGSVWLPKTPYDRPASWRVSLAGFLHGMDSEFLSAVGQVVKRTAQNNVLYTNTYYELAETMFLPCAQELGFSAAGWSFAEGEKYEYYNDTSRRIRYYNNVLYSWWTRTCNWNVTAEEFASNNSGDRFSMACTQNMGVAPCCCIV